MTRTCRNPSTASPNHPTPTEKVVFAATESPKAPEAAPVIRRNTPWPHGQPGLSKLRKLYAIPRAVLPGSAHQPKLDINAIRAQIMSNAPAIATMACVHADYAGEVLKADDPKLFIVTTNEGGQVQAAVVYYQYQPEQHSKIKTVFKGSLAGTDVEALLSLYEESKVEATNWRANLERRGLWSIG